MWHRSFIYYLNESRKRELCLYGADYWGNLAYQLFSLFHITPKCYCDDNTALEGKTLNDIPIMSLKNAASLFPDAVYIVCIDQTETFGAWGRVHQKKMLDNLKAYNVYDSNSELRLAFYCLYNGVKTLAF